jgi:hypothetical protein
VTETNVFELTQPGTVSDPLTEVLRNGARTLLGQAVEAEVAAWLSTHTDKLTDDGRPATGAPRASARARDHDRHRCSRGAVPAQAVDEVWPRTGRPLKMIEGPPVEPEPVSSHRATSMEP